MFLRTGMYSRFEHPAPKVVVVSLSYPGLGRSLQEMLLAFAMVSLVLAYVVSTAAHHRLAVARLERRSLQNMPDGFSQQNVLRTLLRALVG